MIHPSIEDLLRAYASLIHSPAIGNPDRARCGLRVAAFGSEELVTCPMCRQVNLQIRALERLYALGDGRKDDSPSGE